MLRNTCLSTERPPTPSPSLYKCNGGTARFISLPRCLRIAVSFATQQKKAVFILRSLQMLYICILIGLLVASLKNILTGHTQRLVDQTYRI